MSSIGPQLPPHLAKRKRASNDDGAPSSPPSKLPKSSNPNEISLDDDSEDDAYGPSAPAQSRPPIGPAMPPRDTKNADEIDLSGSESDTGPAPAPAPARAVGPARAPPTSTARPPRQASPKPSRPRMGPTMPPSSSMNPAEIDLSDSDSEPGPAPPPASKRTFGPSLPPANLSERPLHPANADSDSDDSDDYGPAPPSSAAPHPSAEERLPLAPKPEAPSKRDDWMLAPPTSNSKRAQDPTKLKNRTFRSGPGAASSAQKAGADGAPNIWTETAAQKLSRLQNAVLGRGDGTPQQQSVSATGRPAGDVGSDFQRARIEEYTAQTRGKSLYDERREAKKAGALRTGPRKKVGGEEEEEDDPSKRAFDKEKDMAIGGRLGAAQKREMLNKAANFGDRFQKGSFL